MNKALKGIAVVEVIKWFFILIDLIITLMLFIRLGSVKPTYKTLDLSELVEKQTEYIMRSSADEGIENDYYLIALGSYYGTEIGTKYRITTDEGNVFYGILADCKADIHTNSTNQYTTATTTNVVEFLVDTQLLNKEVKYHGTANRLDFLSGKVTKIERIDLKVGD